jgi:hypothetical protein
MASGNYQAGYSVTKSGNTTNGLFPPIVCTGAGGQPTVNITVQSPTEVLVQVTFPGDPNPFTIELNFNPVSG